MNFIRENDRILFLWSTGTDTKDIEVPVSELKSRKGVVVYLENIERLASGIFNYYFNKTRMYIT